MHFAGLFLSVALAASIGPWLEERAAYSKTDLISNHEKDRAWGLLDGKQFEIKIADGNLCMWADEFSILGYHDGAWMDINETQILPATLDLVVVKDDVKVGDLSGSLPSMTDKWRSARTAYQIFCLNHGDRLRVKLLPVPAENQSHALPDLSDDEELEEDDKSGINPFLVGFVAIIAALSVYWQK